MTPEQLAAVRGILMIFEAAAQWPVGLVLVAFVIGPWLGLWVFASGQSKRDRERGKQMDSMVTMYENNVELVKASHKREDRTEKHAEELAGIIHLNTQMCTKLIERIDNNMYCPVVRERGPKQ